MSTIERAIDIARAGVRCFDPQLPKSSWIIWALAGAVILGLPATSWLYFPLLLESGTLPPDGDSIMIPMAGSVLLSGVISPFVIGSPSSARTAIPAGRCLHGAVID